MANKFSVNPPYGNTKYVPYLIQLSEMTTEDDIPALQLFHMKFRCWNCGVSSTPQIRPFRRHKPRMSFPIVMRLCNACSLREHKNYVCRCGYIYRAYDKKCPECESRIYRIPTPCRLYYSKHACL